MLVICKIFWALKAYFENLIRIKAHTYDKLEQYAIRNFKDKAKCRSIYHWYLDRNFEIKETKYQRKLNDKELIMTRKENMKRVNHNKKDKTKNNILMLLTSLFKDDYRLKNGDWNKSKIARELGIDVRTVRTHIRDLENENIIK